MIYLRHLLNLLKEFFGFAAEHKKWWLIPVILALLVIGLLIVAGQTTAPFIYTLF